jgi:hypothetical protein
MGNTIPKPEEPTITQQDVEDIITEKDQTISNIQSQVSDYLKTNNNYPVGFVSNEDKVNEVETGWKVAEQVADIQKLINKNVLLSNQLKQMSQEKSALKSAIGENEKTIKVLKNQDTIITKNKIIDVNIFNYREKEVTVTRLVYVINFILYSIGLGFTLAIKLITPIIFVVGFLVGFIILLFYLYTSGPTLEEADRVSTDFSKEAVKGLIQVAAPVKQCPEECVQNNITPY